MNAPFCLRFAIVVALVTDDIQADIKLPAIVPNDMVLKKTAKVTTDSGGTWMTSLDLKNSAAGAFEMTVPGKYKLFLSDVVVGFASWRTTRPAISTTGLVVRPLRLPQVNF